MRWGILLAFAVVVQAGPDKAVRDAAKRLKSKDVETRRDAARELRGHGAACANSTAKIARGLGDDDWSVRANVQAAVQECGARGIPGLIKALKDRNPKVRAGICEVLRHKKLLLHAIPHAKKLTVALNDKEATVRGSAIALFAAMGPAAVDPLLATLKSSRRETRLAAAQALAGAGEKSVRKLGTRLGNEKNARVREGICRACAQMGKKAANAGPALAAAVHRDESEDVRAAAARAIGRTGVGYDGVGDVMLDGLASESETLREGFIDGLSAYGDLAANGLAGRLGSSNRRIHDGAAEALYRMGVAGVKPLQALLSEGTPPARSAAAGIFVRLRWTPDRDDTLEALVGCLAHEDAGVRRDAAAALGRLARNVRHTDDEADGVPAALIAAAGDKDPAVRAAALVSLGRLSVGSAREVIGRSVKDEDASVRIAAAYGAWATGGDAAKTLEQLRAGLAEPKSRLAAVDALGHMASAAEPAVPDLVALLEAKDAAIRRAAARALGTIVRPGRADVRALRGQWRKRAPTKVRAAIEAGLRWLEERQDKSGVWDADKYGGGKLYDPGVTGLALWAFMGAGMTDSEPVKLGLEWLIRTQSLDGIIGSRASHSFMSYHSFATIALAEAWFLTGSPRYAHAVQRAIDYAEYARNPGLAWRYDARDGENDTHITSEIITAIRLGELAGADVLPETYDGAARWVAMMTDPNFGQIGYNFPGGAPARPEGKQEIYPPERSQAMTAAGTWCVQLIGGAALARDAVPLSVKLCLEVPPTWTKQGRDQLYHMFGSLAVHQHGSKAWKTWDKALRRAYVSVQQDDGSWSATGVWGGDGGKVYSTSMAVLSLLTPYRYTPGFASNPKLSKQEKEVVRALRALSKDADPTVADAAARALQRIGPRG